MAKSSANAFSADQIATCFASLHLTPQTGGRRGTTRTDARRTTAAGLASTRDPRAGSESPTYADLYSGKWKHPDHCTAHSGPPSHA